MSDYPNLEAIAATSAYLPKDRLPRIAVRLDVQAECIAILAENARLREEVAALRVRAPSDTSPFIRGGLVRDHLYQHDEVFEPVDPIREANP